MRRPSLLLCASLPLVACTVACTSAPPEGDAGAALSASASAAPLPIDDAGLDAEAGVPAGDPMALHLESKEELLAMFSIIRPPKRDSNADGFLDKSFGPGSPSRINQGNKEIARHLIDKAKCMAGLAGMTIQTEEQKATCGGFENMVPIYKKGRKDKAKACIDVFEFPNKPCELPYVWVAPIQAKVICELQGKRLCAQEEWILACRGDPAGGKDWKFAYGDEMDLEICNTNKPELPGCEPKTAGSTFRTCPTNTEPTGAYPRCRSRFGVFDLHGNVAEAMARRDKDDGHFYSQLKGSAWFYRDVARKPEERPPKGRETYPDHCAYDPRWHVEPINQAWHVNYHLGFRCCKSVKPAK